MLPKCRKDTEPFSILHLTFFFLSVTYGLMLHVQTWGRRRTSKGSPLFCALLVLHVLDSTVNILGTPVPPSLPPSPFSGSSQRSLLTALPKPFAGGHIAEL